MAKFAALAAVFWIAVASAAAAQTGLSLGGLDVDPSDPVEVAADSLSVDQDTGIAKFVGNVEIIQGSLTVTAGVVEVVYSEETGEISRLVASEGVTFVTSQERAEAANAVYDLKTGLLELTGDVILVQGRNSITTSTLRVDLNAKTAVAEGRVRTVLQQGGQ